VKLKRKVKVKNDLGLHIRPAATIAKILQSKQSNVFFSYRNEKVNARSIMGILSLIAKKNAVIEITVDGKDAMQTLEELIKAFNKCFKEE
jgi:phosphocarrier protein